MSKNRNWADKLPIDIRVEKAKKIANKLVQLIVNIINIHESNRLLIYSDQITKQIPPSHAAHTFKLLQQSEFRMEVLSLYALWDKPSGDRFSIPTLISLVDNTGVIDALNNEQKEFWMAPPINGWGLEIDDPLARENIVDQINTNQEAFANRQIQKMDRRRRKAIELVSKSSDCTKIKTIRDFRDRYIAHALDFDDSDDSQSPSLKYGDETWLLEKTIKIVDWLYLAVCGTSFSWDQSRKIAKDRAEKFWSGVKIDVLG
ncbi:MAG: hypothetical protein ACKOBC_07675 [Hyphomicrobiales bacterium]